MSTHILLQTSTLSVLDYRCTAGPADRPFAEVFPRHSVSFVRAGSFGCRSRSRSYELVTGALLIGRTGEEYLCTHDHHHGGDECLSFQFEAAALDALCGDAARLRDRRPSAGNEEARRGCHSERSEEPSLRQHAGHQIGFFAPLK